MTNNQILIEEYKSAIVLYKTTIDLKNEVISDYQKTVNDQKHMIANLRQQLQKVQG